MICIMGLYLLSLGYKRVDKNDYDCVKKFQTIPEEIEISNLGNSHGLYGYCYDNVSNYTCFNFGLVSQSLDYDYRLLEQYQGNLADGGIMFISVSYFSLFGMDESEGEDFASLNKRYYKILSAKYIKKYSLKDDLLVDIFPVMGTADNILYDLATGEERGRIVMDLWEQNLLETSKETIDTDAENTCQRHMANRIDSNGEWIINKANVDALYGIIALCKEKNITPILITTPYLSEYVDEIKSEFPDFFDEFYSFIEVIEKDTGVTYYDYSCDSRFKSEYGLFFSVDHLNRQGALKFTDIVFEDCCNAAE